MFSAEAIFAAHRITYGNPPDRQSLPIIHIDTWDGTFESFVTEHKHLRLVNVWQAVVEPIASDRDLFDRMQMGTASEITFENNNIVMLQFTRKTTANPHNIVLNLNSIRRQQVLLDKSGTNAIWSLLTCCM